MMFYIIPPQSLKPVEQELPFHLFLRNKHSGIKNLACAKYDILGQERLDDIIERVEKGEELLIADEDLEDFAKLFGGEDRILEENKEQIELRRLQRERVDLLKSDYPEEALLFENLVKEAREKESFASLVKAAKTYIEAYSLEESAYFSTLISFCSFALSRSGVMPAGAAFCYFLAKKHSIEDPLDLLEITAAFCLRELGYSYLKLGKDRERDPDYRKYPMFSQHLLTLSKAPFSKNVSRYVLEHRETYLKTGFPRGKGEEHTHFHSYIVGAGHHFFDIYYREFEGKDIDKALAKVANSGLIHPQIAATLYGLKR